MCNISRIKFLFLFQAKKECKHQSNMACVTSAKDTTDVDKKKVSTDSCKKCTHTIKSKSQCKYVELVSKV